MCQWLGRDSSQSGLTGGTGAEWAERLSSYAGAVANLRQLQKQMTRRLLLDNALEQFTTKGYAATTIDDIAAGAGTTRTTFYLHFSSKAEMVHEFIRDMDAMFTAAVDEALDVVIEKGEREPVATWLDHRFDQWVDAKPYLLAAYQAAPAEPEVDNALERWFDETVDAMQRGLDRAGRFAGETRRIRCVLAFGEFEFLARRWLHHGWRVDRSVSHRMLTDSWCHLLIDESPA